MWEGPASQSERQKQNSAGACETEEDGNQEVTDKEP